jgi:transcriptional regulator with XRE-family HTH domain
LGEFIRQRRKAMGLTQEELCAQVGIEQGYLTQIERNKRMGSPDTLLKISRALGIKPAYKIFALFDSDADLIQEEVNATYVKLPDNLSSSDRQLINEIVNRLTELRTLKPVLNEVFYEQSTSTDGEHNAAIEARYDQQLEEEAAANLQRTSQEAG